MTSAPRRTPDSEQSTYSLDHAFVVEFHRHGVASGELAGRLEHLSTGCVGRFGDPVELVELVRRILAGIAAEETEQ